MYDTDLFKMVYGQPYLTLGIKHTAQIAPSHCKVRLGLNGFQVTSLQWVFNGIPQKRRKRGRVGKIYRREGRGLSNKKKK